MTRDKAFPFFFMLLISVTPLMATEFPRFLCFWPSLVGLVMSIWWVKFEGGKYKISKNYLIITGALSVLCLTSTLWSIERSGTLENALKTALVMIPGVFLFSLCQNINIQKLKPFAWMLPFGVILAGLISFNELLNDLPLYKIIRGYDSDFRGNHSVMNRGIVGMVFASFTAYYLTRFVEPLKTKALIRIALGASILAALFMTESQSAQLAFLIGVLAVSVFPVRYKWSFKLLAVMIVCAMCTTPFIISILFDLLIDEGQSIPWLKDAYAGSRVEIWDFVLRYAMQSPLTGFGMEATRYVTDFQTLQLNHKDNTILHPHNFSLQIWMEFGIIGVAIVSILFAFLLNHMRSAPISASRYAIASFLSVLSVAAMGYGIWQSWWIGELIFIASLCALITNFAEEEKRENA